MDPDACLNEMLLIANRMVDEDSAPEEEALRLAELVQALDGWIKGGGFLPAAWRAPRPA